MSYKALGMLLLLIISSSSLTLAARWAEFALPPETSEELRTRYKIGPVHSLAPNIYSPLKYGPIPGPSAPYDPSPCKFLGTFCPNGIKH